MFEGSSLQGHMIHTANFMTK